MGPAGDGGARARTGGISGRGGAKPLQILPDGTDPGRVPEQRRRMIGGHEGNPAVLVYRSAQPPDRLVRLQQGLRGKGPAGQDRLRADQLELPEQKGRARSPPPPARVPVPRRPALQDVADVHATRAESRWRRAAVSRSLPARPTKGRPVRSSSAPGPHRRPPGAALHRIPGRPHVAEDDGGVSPSSRR
jgi:hypothetical protein